MSVAVYGKTSGPRTVSFSATQSPFCCIIRMSGSGACTTVPVCTTGKGVAIVTVDTCVSQGVSAEHVQRRCGMSDRRANVMEVETTQWIAVERKRSVMGPGCVKLVVRDPAPFSVEKEPQSVIRKSEIGACTETHTITCCTRVLENNRKKRNPNTQREPPVLPRRIKTKEPRHELLGRGKESF